VDETQPDRPLPTVVLLERNGRYFVYEPGLALISSDGDIKVAYEKFAAARHSYFEDIGRAGLTFNASSLATPGTSKAQSTVGRSFRGELALFAAKLCVVLVFIAVIGASLGIVVQQLAAANSAQGGLSMVDIANKAEVIAKDVQAMPQERKDALRRSIGVLSRELEPIVEAWRNSPPVPEREKSPSSSVPPK
jgi:hypothetical protein